MRKTTRYLITLGAIAALTLAACGGGNDDADTASGDTTDEMADDTSNGDMTDGDMEDMEDHDEEGDHDDSFAFGEPGDPADADRTVEIEANDSLKFDPDSVEVTAGETVTFVITNTGNLDHEFVLGDEAAQADMEAEMADMEGGMEMHHDPNAITLPAGETMELTWTFTTAGEVLFGCHVPGHYDAGMRGTVTVG